MDETGLFFKMMPDKTMTFRNDTCHGGKKSKDRLTVLIGANVTGTEKLPILVIGKYQSPRCFKNVRTLPTLYKGNLKAWMTFQEWEYYLRYIDRMFQRKSRKIVLIVDNCPSHLEVDGLQSITVKYLPPNSTTLIQPMDQGIIQNFKVHYRKLLIKKIILSLESNNSLPNLNVLDGCHMTKLAWDQVLPNTIANCFKKAWPTCNDDIPLVNNNNENSISEVETFYWQNPIITSLTHNVNFMEYLNVDDHIILSEDLSDDDILNSVRQPSELTDIDSDHEIEIPAIKDLENYLNSFRNFFSCHANCEVELQHLNDIEQKLEQIRQKSLTQRPITDFTKKLTN